MNQKSKLIIGFGGLVIAGLFIWAVITTTQLVSKQSELAAVEAELSTTQSTLNETRGELIAAGIQLEDTKTRLATVQNELDDTKTELTLATGSLSLKTTELNSTKIELATLNAELTSSNIKLTTAQDNITELQEKLTRTQEELTISQGTLRGLGITLYSSSECNDVELIDNPQAVDPTLNQLLSFLATDFTEYNTYILNVYDCSQFSRDVHNNAEAAGIRAAEVQVWFTNSDVGHALNAFLTTDHGLVYVDCTDVPDSISRVKVAKVYRSLEVLEVPPAQIRNDNWWDALTSYYYINVGGQVEAIVEDISIFW